MAMFPGLPGSGKTSIIENVANAESMFVINNDKLRGMWKGNEYSYSQVLDQKVIYGSSLVMFDYVFGPCKFNVCVDEVLVSAEERALYIERARKLDPYACIICVPVLTTPEECIRRRRLAVDITHEETFEKDKAAYVPDYWTDVVLLKAAAWDMPSSNEDIDWIATPEQFLKRLSSLPGKRIKDLAQLEVSNETLKEWSDESLGELQKASTFTPDDAKMSSFYA